MTMSAMDTKRCRYSGSGHAIQMFLDPNIEWTPGFPYVLISTCLAGDKIHNTRDHAIPLLAEWAYYAIGCYTQPIIKAISNKLSLKIGWWSFNNPYMIFKIGLPQTGPKRLAHFI